ncbi:Nucleotide-binding universal stress protein, UspA family [Flavobacteriaceae bacterium MAR_2010_188]|nr:Nucleotide-binding universal stress protein, UspA family [Flavobacteriaceae bacterium MAR_2010_188]
MQHILIPTDFSQNSWNATEYALSFFHGKNITFHFLHVIISTSKVRNNKPINAEVLETEDIPESLKLQMKLWEENAEELAKDEKFNFSPIILKSAFIEGIRNYIKINKIDYLIMGSRGVSGLEDTIVGSKTGAVIKRIKCTTLVIPEQATFKKPINIGFPTDLNAPNKNRAMRSLLKIVSIYHSSIKVIRVAQTQKALTESQNNHREVLKEQLKKTHNSFHLIENPNLDNSLDSFISSMKIDMIALMAKNLNLFQRILFKVPLENISYHLYIPLLVLHE